MRRSLPVWVFAALPATLAGHALAYVVTGQSAADGHHGYLGPLFAWSATTLLTVCSVLLAGALTRSGAIAHLRMEPSAGRLLLRLGPLQVVLFWGLERAEGFSPSLLSYAAQLLVALVVALALAYFARLFARCVHAARDASVYLCRRFDFVLPSRLAFAPIAAGYALKVRAGESRFERPPPNP
ncbi:MAG: hypothetical protein ABI346_03485 [Candidatus Baltobacteraceae bacterium]